MLKDSISSRKIRWIQKTNLSTKRTAVLIPQYNELSCGNFVKRLRYFNELAEAYDKILDVIIIDDGSTDNSLQIIEKFIEDNSVSFDVAAVTPNSNKIGALFLTILNINYDYILFSDFDTDLVNLEFLLETLIKLDRNPIMMGCYFRMIPVDGVSIITRYQKFEYAVARTWYKYISAEKTVGVMPGAGCLYKHRILKRILENHSGLRNGEDRETTILGLKLGYKVFYQKRILAMTRTPDTIQKLISQRVRWNLGYLETLNKEKGFYFRQSASFTRIGARSLFDIFNNILLFIISLLIVLLATLSFKACVLAILFFYLSKLFWIYFFLQKDNTEIEENNLDYMVWVMYPLFKAIVEFLAWFRAMYKFLTTDYYNYPENSMDKMKSNGEIFKNNVSSSSFVATNLQTKVKNEEKNNSP